MFKFKRNKKNQIKAPVNGEVISIKDVPDEAFAQKMLGDGVAVLPSDGKVLSPVDGTVINVTETLHAYCINSDDDLDILIHFGLNTVELKGEGFKTFVKEGDKVKTGDLIAEADLDFIKEKGYPLHTPIVITNIKDIKDIDCITGKAEAGKTVIIEYSKS